MGRQLRFSDIGELLEVSPSIRAKYYKYYTDIYNYVCETYEDRPSYQAVIVDMLNTMLYFLMTDGNVPYDWEDKINIDDFDYQVSNSAMSSALKEKYLSVEDITWNVNSVSVKDLTQNKEKSTEEKKPVNSSSVGKFRRASEPSPVKDKKKENKKEPEQKQVFIATPKEDLFITTPKYPRVGSFDERFGNIHVSLPKVPTKQCEVSCTTKVSDMTDAELMKLYPKQFIKTRSEFMYKPKEGITLDPKYGLLLPVDGFTDAEVRDCVIRYPHIFRLKRVVDDELVNFYRDIEIDGELVPILEVWSYLPESKIININEMDSRQEQIEFMKEYAIRRYLLERDIKKVKHKYPVRGSLGEFITLFMTPQEYEIEGYGDAVGLASTCVTNRVDYLISRNPRINQNVTVKDCVLDGFCTASICDRSCPKWTQINYLMKQNSLKSDDKVFKMNDTLLNKYLKVYDNIDEGTTALFVQSDEIFVSEALSYIGICKLWNGSAIRTEVYNLRYSKYLDMMKDSWGDEKSEDFVNINMWSHQAKVLIVSGIDYVNFKDFQSQTLLQLLQDRDRDRLKTIVVSPKVENLAGDGKMFNLLKNKLSQRSVKLD